MADKKLNALNVVNNAKYAYLEDANGNQVKMEMSTLASVVGGLNGNIGYKIQSSGLIKLQGNAGYSSLLFIRTQNATGVYVAAGNWSNLSVITKISSPLNDDHLSFYRGKNGSLYVKGTDEKGGLEARVVSMNGGEVPTVSYEDMSTLIKLSV